jgi:cystathionine beta-lyase
MSLAGVESTLLSPSKTSHALMSAEVRAEQGISDGLIRFSVGIEELEDLQYDISQALEAVKKESPVSIDN